jgi:stringent starvation protein B
MSIKNIVTAENYLSLQNLTVQTEYCVFVVIADAIADPTSFLNSQLHVGQSFNDEVCYVTITRWINPEAMYFKDLLLGLQQELELQFNKTFPAFVEKQFISITDFSGQNNKYHKQTYYKNLPGIFSYAQQLYRNVFIVIDTKRPDTLIGAFTSAVTPHGTLVLNVSTKGIGWMSVDVEKETIQFACRFRGNEQIVTVPFDALLAVYDPDGPTEIVSKGQIFDDSETVVETPEVETQQPIKRPAFQVISGGKTD